MRSDHRPQQIIEGLQCRVSIRVSDNRERVAHNLNQSRIFYRENLKIHNFRLLFFFFLFFTGALKFLGQNYYYFHIYLFIEKNSAADQLRATGESK